MEGEGKKKAKAVMSKKRFKDFEQALRLCDDSLTVEFILEQLCEVMQYDPTMSQYNEEHAERIRAHRQKIKKETGLSIYEACGAKRLYHEKKQQKTATAS